MPKPSDIRIRHVEYSTEKFVYRTPVKFGGRVVADAVVVNVAIDVETRDGRRARGEGSMPMGNAWAWPSSRVSVDQSLAAMLEFGQQFAENAAAYTECNHPLQMTRNVGECSPKLAGQVVSSAALAEPMPVLAQLVASSPVEAAIHDGYGKALGINSYNALGPEFVSADLGSYLSPEFAGEYLDRYTAREPKSRMPLYHLIGALDPLHDGEIQRRLADGLPETLSEWIAFNGLTHLKIKLAGDDLKWDVDRVLSVDRVAAEAQGRRGCREWFYSVDFNEKCSSVEYVLDFLAKVQTGSPEAMGRIQYIEQPTHRDLKANPENRMHAAARIKPVVIDESLVDLESLLIARDLGYSGVALKACKGQTEALLMGAAAQKYNLFLCVQDLTCIGRSFLHSASIAARIPTIAAIEGNGRQYCPAGNRGWDQQFPSMFRITDGTVGTSALIKTGLGF